MPSQAQSDLTKNTQMFTEEELASVRRRGSTLADRHRADEPAPRERSLRAALQPVRLAASVGGPPYTPCVSPREPASEFVLPYRVEPQPQLQPQPEPSPPVS